MNFNIKALLPFALLFGNLLFGQQSENKEVTAPIHSLFLAMKNADPELLKSVFTDAVIMQSVATEGNVKNEKIEDFIGSVSKFSKNDLDERISIASVQVDGNLASVFTPYEFYFKGKFSHCGANSFQLVKQNNVWKIQYLIDTRRKDCKK